MKNIAVLVDERISKSCEDSLSRLGFKIIKLPRIDRLPSAIASHTDILAFKLFDKIFFSRAYFEANFDLLSPLGRENVILTEENQGVNYPLNAIFNGLLVGNRLFCKKDSFSKEILSHSEAMGIKTVAVKQGYPACTALKISENAVITADVGMARTLSGEDVEVLLIENGGISLPPYEYGFIGGAAGSYADEIFFLGDIKSHKNADDIINFIEKNGKRAVSLSDEPLSDLGGMIFI